MTWPAVAEWIDLTGRRRLEVFDSLREAVKFAEKIRKDGVEVVTWEM